MMGMKFIILLAEKFLEAPCIIVMQCHFSLLMLSCFMALFAINADVSLENVTAFMTNMRCYHSCVVKTFHVYNAKSAFHFTNIWTA